MLKDYFKLAFGNLTHRRLRSWLTMIGIFIGIAAVVSLISLGQGMQAAITQQFAALGANTVTVQPKGGGFGPPGTLSATNLTEDDLEEVRRASGVHRAFGRLIRAVQVDFNDRRQVVFVGTFPPETEDRDFLIDARDYSVSDGRMLESGDTFKVVVGTQYGAEPTFGRELRVGDKLTMQGRSVDVLGILERTGSPEADFAMFMNEEPLRDILEIKEEYDVILARVSEGRNVTLVADSIERRLRNSRNVDDGEEDFQVQTSQELLETFTTILNVVQIVLIGIAGISLLVGGVGITNTMYTAVLERTREIGIMKAIGARNSDVMTLFLIESGMLGMSGGAIGIAIGIGLSKAVEYIAVNFGGIDLVRAYFPLYLILGALFFSFVVGAIAGLTPARKASRMNPVEALRK